MNKTAIKNFAIWARKKLIADITYKAGLLGISEKGMKSPLPQSTKNVQFFDIGTKDPYSISDIEVKQREVLVETINTKSKNSDYSTAYKAIVEEVAYTWFNRLIAVRFMEINDYLPSRIRVLSSESATKNEPDLVTKPFDTDLDFSPYEKDRIVQLTHETKYDELFRLLFIKQCNALNAFLPNLFEKTSDFTELLLYVSITDKDGVVYHLVHDIAEDDFNVSKEGQIEIIGWMYQYYNTEPKDEVFALLKNNVKITKESIPAATQLFTPDWIVRYMVENSLGRLWIEGHPNDTLKSGWKYYLDEAEQDADVQIQLDTIRKEYKTIKPEDIKIIDPCMGSGHILVYAFDILMQIYECAGYNQRDAAKKIIEHNIYGLDIDNRAYQLSYFAVMMKARQYNRRILNDSPKCHLFSIQESNGINRRQLQYFGLGMNGVERNAAIIQIDILLNTFIDAKEYGSILSIENLNWELLNRFIGDVVLDRQMALDAIGIEYTAARLLALVEMGAIMSQTYDVVVTNPPYMGSSGMNTSLLEYVKKKFSYGKNDLYATFILKCMNLAKKNGHVGMMTSYTWMFLSAYEDLRSWLVSEYSIQSLIQPEYHSFFQEAFVPICTFVIRNSNINFKGTYINLSQFVGAENQPIKVKEAIHNNRCGFLFEKSQQLFCEIAGTPIAYWLSSSMNNTFRAGTPLGNVAYPRQGLATGNNEVFLRYWFEPQFQAIGFGHKSIESFHGSTSKYAPYNKGGAYRKWYGNRELLIKFNIENYNMLMKQGNHLPSRQLYFHEGCNWSALTISSFSCRYTEPGFVFDTKGSSCFFSSSSDLYYGMGLLNSKIANVVLNVLSPTMDYNCGTVSKVPFIPCSNNNKLRRLINIVIECINISKNDWDSFEISWDFTTHPLLKHKAIIASDYGANEEGSYKIANAFSSWADHAQDQFQQIITFEEELNQILIETYGLQNEMTSIIEEKDVTIRKADLGREIRSLISYAVGCMFGRYSLDIEGLSYAGGRWDDSKYSTFIPARNNILPITDEEYFEDDIVGLFTTFIKQTFGDKYLEENLDFIANALNCKGNTSREIIRNYFIKDFFKDHCKIYQKRPIYWLFDTGKADGFKTLMYLHRYDENTIGNLRIDYLHRMQRIYDNEIIRMVETIECSSNAREVSTAEKRKEKLTKQLKETKEYDEKIAHLALAQISLDLDDGVMVNYEKIQTGTDGKKQEVLSKI